MLNPEGAFNVKLRKLDNLYHSESEEKAEKCAHHTSKTQGRKNKANVYKVRSLKEVCESILRLLEAALFLHKYNFCKSDLGVFSAELTGSSALNF